MPEDEYDWLLKRYIESGGLYATILVAVIFGQFSVLRLLQSKGRYMTHDLAVWVLIVVYAVIVVVGFFVVYYYMIFAGLLEHLKSSHFSKFNTLDKRMRREVGEWKLLREGRASALQRRRAVVAIYVIISFGALASTLLMP
jgi:hypothetical protein